MNNRLINTKVAAAGGCTDIVDNYDPFGGNGVALYQLNGDATDVSTNYDGAASNVTYGTGVFGQAGVFNGSSSVINTNLDLDAFDEEWSISMWVKFNFDSNSRILAQDTDSNQLNGFVIDMGTSGELRWRLRDSITSVGSVSSVNTYGDGQWHHLVAVKSNTTNYIYIDGGAEVDSASTVNGINHSSGITYGKNSANSIFYNGQIDQVRIFNTALDPLEVEALYTEELCICDGTVDTLQVLGDTSCIATYQLDGNANDLSGNYSGTPTDVSYGVGEFDLAGVFNGSSRIEVPFASKPSLSTCTVSFWLKTTSTNTQALIGEGYSSNYWGNLQIYLASNKLNARSGNASNAEDSAWLSTSDVNTGDWVHCVVTISGNTSNIYINGSLETTKTLTVTRAATTNPFTIGQMYANGSLFTSWVNDCQIDQVRIFNKALDQNDVDILFAETACTKVCTGTTNTLNILGGGDTSCIAAYPLDGSPADLSGNYNGVQTDVTYPQGNFDLAGSFNGSSSNITLPTGSPFNDSNTIKSVSAWVKLNSTSNRVYPFSVSSTTVANDFFNFGYLGDSNNILVAIRDGSSSNQVLHSVSVAIDTDWHHIVVQTTGNSVEIYLDGVSQTISSTYAGTGSSSSWISYPSYGGSVVGNIGISRKLSSVFSNGKIDQVRFFDKALSLEEVGILFNDETPCS